MNNATAVQLVPEPAEAMFPNGVVTRTLDLVAFTARPLACFAPFNRRLQLLLRTRPWVCGVMGALAMSFVFALLRATGISSINFEAGLGSFAIGGPEPGAWVAGFAWHLLNGALIALGLTKILAKLELKGAENGAIAGFVFWFCTSMMMGALPQLDLLTAPGSLVAGPFGAQLGLTTFYVLLAVHIGFGAWVGWCMGLEANEVTKV